MIRVKLHAPRGAGPADEMGVREGFTLSLEMPAVPRQGDGIALLHESVEVTYVVHRVYWYPYSSTMDAYVVLRNC